MEGGKKGRHPKGGCMKCNSERREETSLFKLLMQKISYRIRYKD